MSPRKKIFAVLANRILDIEPTNFFVVPAKFELPQKKSLLITWFVGVLPKNSFVGSSKSVVDKSQIFLGQQIKFVGSI